MTTQGVGSKLPKAVWHKNTVHTFCDICIRAIEKMFRPYTHFNKQGWDFIVNEFRKETQLNYGPKQLKNKWDALKRDYKLWKDLKRNETGLGWDAHKNTVGADDAWWEEKIKINPSFAAFKIGGIEPHLEGKLELMFSTIVATREFAISPGCNVGVTPPEEPADVECGGDSLDDIPFEDSFEEMFDCGSTQPGLASNKKRNVEARGDSSRSSIRSKKGKRQAGGAAMLVRQIDTLVSAVAARSSTVSSKVTEPDVPTLRSIVAELKTMPGLDINSDIFMFATRLLKDKLKREVFIELKSPELKLNWLIYNFTHYGPNK